MKTITKTYNLYEFNELSKDIQQKVLSDEIELIREDDINYILCELLEETAMNLLHQHFKNAVFNNINYSLSYCQGDGVMIEFEATYYNKSFKVIHDNSFYYHENAFRIIDDSLTNKQYNAIKTKIVNINKELEKIGYDFIEEDREELALENINNYLFYEDGKIYEGTET